MKYQEQPLNIEAVVNNRRKKLIGSYGRTIVYRHGDCQSLPIRVLQQITKSPCRLLARFSEDIPSYSPSPQRSSR